MSESSKMENVGTEAYCVKCKAKRPMVEGHQVTMKNGRNAMQGKCETCGTGMYKILPKQKD
jgi:hypothetical protein